MTTKFRVVPKRDWPRAYGKVGFLVRGEWVSHGFVVTNGLCNVMPGATWFYSVSDAFKGIEALVESKGNSDLFWTLVRSKLGVAS